MPNIATLCAADDTVETAYLCHPAVQHIASINGFMRATGEGNWACGYRNLQMLFSYLVLAMSSNESVGNGEDDGEHFQHGHSRRDGNEKGKRKVGGEVPTVLQLQEMIEEAWDLGLNAHGRIQTGGIKGTRKFIGTSEVSGADPILSIRIDGSHTN